MENRSDKANLLVERARNELDEYCEQELQKSPNEIMNNACETYIKHELFYMLNSNYEFDEAVVEGLIKTDYPLDACYQRWLKEDISFVEDLSYIMEREAKALEEYEM